jgi:hypothetical protein
MAITEKVDYLLYKSAIRVDGSLMNQHKGNLFVTKKYIMLVVAHNMDMMELAFGETGHEHEYKDDNTLNPFKNIASGIHNIGVAGKEVKKSFEDNRKFHELEKQVKLNYKIIREKAQTAQTIEELEEAVRQMCLPNELSLVIRVDQIHEMVTGFFKTWFGGFRLLMKDGLQFKVVTGKGSKIRKFIGK